MADGTGSLPYSAMIPGWGFDPTQMSNQFSNYNNQALPWPSSYNMSAGLNTATGAANPNYMPPASTAAPGTTLNSTPDASSAFLQQALGMTPSQQNMGGLTSNQMLALAMGPQMAKVVNTPGMQSALGVNQAQAPMQQQGGAGAPANNWNAAITALANPGQQAVYGANIPQAQPAAARPNVLDSFLANQSGKTGAAGAYNNQPFFSNLQQTRKGS